MFGGDLAALCESQGTKVPHFLLQFIDYIEEEGFNLSGIYRLSTEAGFVTGLKSMVEEGTGI